MKHASNCCCRAGHACKEKRQLAHLVACLYTYIDFVFIGLVTDDMFELIVTLNLGIALLSAETLAQQHADLAERVLNRFLELAEQLFGSLFFTIVVHQVNIDFQVCLKALFFIFGT